jgi:hypothetical protein
VERTEQQATLCTLPPPPRLNCFAIMLISIPEFPFQYLIMCVPHSSINTYVYLFQFPNINFILIGEMSMRISLLHMACLCSGSGFGSCVVGSVAAKQLLASFPEVLPLVGVDEGIHHTVKDPKKHQPTGQVKVEIRGNAKSVSINRNRLIKSLQR